MLYTVRPLERIYALPETFNPQGKGIKEEGKNQALQEADYQEVLLPNGRIITRREGEGYVIERVNSTDMKDYLNANYAPGKSYKDNKNKRN